MRPGVTLLDARDTGLDPAGLRAAARELPAATDARFTSRSYRYPYALVAWYDTPVGIDIEEALTHTEELAAVLCTPDERQLLETVANRDLALRELWSSKEALAKALGDALAYEPSRLPAPALWPDGCSGRWRAAAVPAPDGHVAWLCWRAS